MSSLKYDAQYTLLRDAIRKTQKTTALKLLLDGAPVNPLYKSTANTPLHWAIKNAYDIDFIEMLLNKGANIHAKNSDRETPLQLAFSYNRVDIVKLIIDKGIRINDDIQTLIDNATTDMNIDLVKLLFKHAIQTNIYINLENAIEIAAKNAYVDILKYLLSHYKPHNIIDRYIPKEVMLNINNEQTQEVYNLLLQHGFTIRDEVQRSFDFIYAATENRYHNIVRDSLQLGIDVNLINKKTGLTLLHVACKNEDEEMVQILIENNADVNIIVSGELTDMPCFFNLNLNSSLQEMFINKSALYIAVYKSSVNILKLLLTNGADISDEPNILLTAAKISSNNIIEVLVDCGADVNTTDSFGRTPLYYRMVQYKRSSGCCTSKKSSRKLKNNEPLTEIITLLLSKAANPNVITGLTSPLQAAIADGYLNIVELLLKYRANINHLDAYENTPLHYAINSNLKILDAVLDYGPDVNIVNLKSITPLLMSVKKMNTYALVGLLKRNANINAVDKMKNSALHLVLRNRKNWDIIKLLLNYDVNVNAKNNKGQAPLHVITINSKDRNSDEYEDIVKTLVNNKVLIDIEDNQGRTPLAIAFKKSKKSVNILLKYGANINKKNKCGKTLLHDAVEQNDCIMFKYLLNCGANINILSSDKEAVLDFIKISVDFRDETEYHRHRNRWNRNNQIESESNSSSDESDSSPGESGSSSGESDSSSDESDSSSHESDSSSVYHLDTSVSSIEIDEDRITIYKSAREHIIKLHCAKLKVIEQNLDLIYKDFDLREQVDSMVNVCGLNGIENIIEIEERCKNEIEKLKNERFGCMSLYDILSKDTHDIIQITRNKEIIETVKSDNLEVKFPIYANIIKNKFAKAVRRHKLLKTAVKYSPSTILDKLPPACIEHIFSFLNYKNLKKFVCAIKYPIKLVRQNKR